MHSILFTAGILTVLGQPVLQDAKFELPTGFHIYKAATPELTDESYDISFDADGRLLIGDSKNIRRLIDNDSDGVFDASEVIATGLGPRGPQGLLVYGDRVFAVGGDGVQLFSGYLKGGALKHEGRVGEPFHTGGDHAAHMIFRGHDDYLYFITGDGGGTKDRKHITEDHSPVLFERNCSVFRISPDGERWECVGSGGRNSPNVGMNYLGDLFSLDSDMEWHVEMPWWRPVRLHHWIAGGDQGWQGVGAYPPYYVDNLAGILDVGRGSPCWGQFYEHEQFPEEYRGSFLVCDYPWKSATTGRYNKGGQIYSFSLTREGASWKATKSVLARPRPGATDTDGSPVRFGVVDLEIAPDGSLFVSERAQGVWRIVYAPDGRVPAVVPNAVDKNEKPVESLLTLLQPQSEWSRLHETELRTLAGATLEKKLQDHALSHRVPLSSRLRAVRLLTPAFATLAPSFLKKLAQSTDWELRAQSAWLVGLQAKGEVVSIASDLLEDEDPFVRRRACEALMRLDDPTASPALIRRLEDDDRRVRYAAMIALTHRPPESWFHDALAAEGLQTRVRALVARHLLRQPPTRNELVESVTRLLRDASSRAARGDLTPEDHLDVLRVLGIYRDQLVEESAVRDRVAVFVRTHFPSPHKDLHREGARLLGDYRLASAFLPLLTSLEQETDPVHQFHLAQSLARIPAGWSSEEETRATNWFLSTQEGWFAEFDDKGRQFPSFWRTVLADFCRSHTTAVVARFDEVALDGLLANPVLEAVSAQQGGHRRLAELYQNQTDPAARRAIVLGGLGKAPGAEFGEFLREAYRNAVDPKLRAALLVSVARRPEHHTADIPLLEEGLAHEERDVVQACAAALKEHKLTLDETRLATLVELLERREPLLHTYEDLLVAWTATERPGYGRTEERVKRRRPTAEVREAAVTFWQGWYSKRFGHAAAGVVALASERSDEELRQLLTETDWSKGEPGRGLQVYEAARCATCHGGGTAGDTLFGPDLVGIAKRLSRPELIDSLVYPSKRVEDRFKGVVAQLEGGLPIAGFLTAEDKDSVTLATQERVHRIARKELLFLAPQETSLMPERLLNRLPDKDIVDLMAFLSGPRRTK